MSTRILLQAPTAAGGIKMESDACFDSACPAIRASSKLHYCLQEKKKDTLEAQNKTLVSDFWLSTSSNSRSNE